MLSRSGDAQTLGPVMTLQVGREWLGVPVVQLDRVVSASRLYPVPLTRPDYLGLLDNGQELVPVMQLAPEPLRSRPAGQEQLIVIVHVRGEAVGLAIDRAGQLCTRYQIQIEETADEMPELVAGVPARLALAETFRFWLIDTDQLWQETPAPCGPATLDRLGIADGLPTSGR